MPAGLRSASGPVWVVLGGCRNLCPLPDALTGRWSVGPSFRPASPRSWPAVRGMSFACVLEADLVGVTRAVSLLGCRGGVVWRTPISLCCAISSLLLSASILVLVRVDWRTRAFAGTPGRDACRSPSRACRLIFTPPGTHLAVQTGPKSSAAGGRARRGRAVPGSVQRHTEGPRSVFLRLAREKRVVGLTAVTARWARARHHRGRRPRAGIS